MLETKIFDTTSELKLMGLINDLHRHERVTNIQYSTYIVTLNNDKPVIHYTACVTYTRDD